MKKLLIVVLCMLLCLTACTTLTSEKATDTKKAEDTKETKIDVTNNSLEEVIDKMTLEEKVGQMFIARCPNVDAAIYAKKYKLGGYILFGQDFKDSDPDTIKKTIQSYQDAMDIPMFIAVDEEGGTVNRVSRYPQFRETPFPSPQELYKSGGFEAVAADAKEKSEFLMELGVNVNFAPVCDISNIPDAFMYARSVALNTTDTCKYAETVVSEMEKAGIGSVLKHFPGYGNNPDTHTDIVVDTRPYKTFETSDFLPFKAGIDAGAGIVLVSHNIVECMDKEYPASLSPEVNRILREELGFDGLIITDDLVMDAITEYTDNESAAVQAVIAGNDLLCCTDFTEQVPAVIKAVQDGRISEERINESVLRILEYKIKNGTKMNCTPFVRQVW